jgi:hypothetical protein
VPITERKILNFLSDNWMRNAHKLNQGAGIADFLFKVSRTHPPLLWPKDHPKSLVFNKIFECVVAAAATELGLAPEDWTARIITLPG